MDKTATLGVRWSYSYRNTKEYWRTEVLFVAGCGFLVFLYTLNQSGLVAAVNWLQTIVPTLIAALAMCILIFAWHWFTAPLKIAKEEAESKLVKEVAVRELMEKELAGLKIDKEKATKEQSLAVQQEQHPEQFISIELLSIQVDKDDLRIRALDVKLRSSLLRPFKITSLSIGLHIDGVFARFETWDIGELPAVTKLYEKEDGSNWYQPSKLICEMDVRLPQNINMTERHNVKGTATVIYDEISEARKMIVSGLVEIHKWSQDGIEVKNA